MKIAIIGGDSQSYDLLKNTLEKLIEDSQQYLFTVLCGSTNRSNTNQSLGERFAEEYGALVEYVYDANPQKLLNKIAYKADYIIFIVHDEQWIKNFMMQYKMSGKHGTVIQSPFKVKPLPKPKVSTYRLPQHIWKPLFEEENIYEWQIY